MRIDRRVGFLAATALALGLSASCSNHDEPGSLSQADRTGPLPIPGESVLNTEAPGGKAAGGTPGAFTVTPDGAASYSIALWVPPGRAGMQPELALQYDSRGGDGILGMGWSLRGLPEIARCKKRLANDGFAGPITFDNADPYCLDGHRLVLVAGTHNQEGAEYRTERDSFVKVVAHSPDALGPTSFTGYLKDGSIVTFGDNGVDKSPTLQSTRVHSVPPPPNGTIYTDPNIVTQTETVRLAWAAGLFEDRAGNTMRVTYAQPLLVPPPGPPGIARMLFPQQIDYTDSKAPAKNGQARRSVRFSYKGPHDLNGDGNGYASGLPWWQGARLDRIDMLGPDPVEPLLLRSYILGYAANTVTGRQLLASVTEKDRGGVALASTTFDWEKGSLDYDISATGIDDIAKDAKYRWLETADINGDGLTDLVYIRENAPTKNYYVRLSDRTKFGPPLDSVVSYAKSGHPPFAINFNHDGRDDLLLYVDHYPPGNNQPPIDKDDTPCVGRTVGLGGNANKPSFVLGPCFPDRKALGGDLNGDGISDLLSYVPGDAKSWQYFLNTPPTGGLAAAVGFTGPFDTVATLSTPNKWELEVADVDGDGAGELIGFKDNNDQRRGVFELGRSPRFPPINIFQGTLWSGVDLFFTDVNDDGLPDAVAWNDDNATISTFVDTGNGYSNYIKSPVGSTTVPPNNLVDSGIRVFDYDGDGRGDVILRASSGGLINPGDHVVVMRSNGSGFKPAINLPSQVTGADAGLIQPLDVNGDGLDDLVVYDNGQLLLYKHKGKKPDLMTRVVDGLGAVTTVTYEPVSNREVYTPAKSCAWPTTCVRSGMWVVAQHTSSNGNGGMNAWQYRYSDGRADVRGRGFLGMGTRTVQFSATGRSVVETYDLSLAAGKTFYPFLGLPKSVTEMTTLEPGRTRVHTVNTTYDTHVDGNNVYFPFATVVDEKDSETTPTGTTVLSSFHATRAVDDFDNLLDLVRVSGDAQSFHFHADYENQPANWLVERVSLVEETATVNGESATRRRGFVWDALGMLREEVLEPGAKSAGGWLPRVPSGPNDDGVKTLYRIVDRYTNGLVKREVLDESDTTPTANLRSSDYTYAPDDEQVFIASRVDALGHKVRTAFHPGLGALVASDDDNNVLSTWQVDGFGRTRIEKSSGCDSTAVSYGVQAGTALPQITATLASGPKRIVDFDALGRPARAQSLTRKDGNVVITERQYDDFGRGLKGESRPHFAFEPPVFTTYDYDNLGRVRFVHGADGGTSELRYAGLTTQRFDSKLNLRQQRTDQLGQVLESVEFASSGALTTSYTWGPFSTLRAVRDTAGNTTSIGYDRLGRKLTLADPDAGHHAYTYTAFGEPFTESINGAPQSSSRYDRLGRLTLIESKDGLTRFTWDLAANGVGMIGQSVSPDGIITRYAYDPYARLRDTTWTAGSSQLTVTRDYDGYGRLHTLWYPGAPGRPTRFAVDYIYAPAGNLDQVVDHAANKAPAYYTVLDSDGAGQPTNASGSFPQARLGNGVTARRTEDAAHRGFPQRIEAIDAAGASVQRLDLHFDLNGNLDQRTDALTGTSESFGYDASDRMTNWGWSGGGVVRDTRFDYDDLGNLRARTVAQDSALDVSYAYDGAGGAGPHGVTARNGQPYGYDGKGRQTSGPDRTVDYNWFELPSRITTPAAATRFGYDANQQRVLKRVSNGDLSVTVGGLYELRSHGDSAMHVFTIQARRMPVAQMVWRQNGGQFVKDTVQYLLDDQLGSVDTVMSGTGALVERLKYDPFGGRVDPARLDRPQAASASGERAGFTGHEHDDELGLINMRGRIYDPKLGRFLTVDPFVDDPLYGQGHNRYAYVGNNPLSWRDPSGFVKDGDMAGVVDGWPVSGVVYYSSSNAPRAGSGKSQNKRRQAYNPREWSVIQLDLVPDAPAPPPLKYPDNPKLQSTLEYGKRFYDTADHVGGKGDYDTIEDKDGNVLISTFGHRAGADSSATLQIDEIYGAVSIIGIVGRGALKLTSKKAYSVAYETVIEATGKGTRGAHNTAANRALLRDMAADAELGETIKRLEIEVPEDLSQSPCGWSWHHCLDAPGRMQLVPFGQHTNPDLRPLFHRLEGGRWIGGFKQWGKDF